jgi:hypothetical protein
VTLTATRNENATSGKQRPTGFVIEEPKKEAALVFAEFQPCLN